MLVIGVDAPQGWCCLDVVAGKGTLLGLGNLDEGEEALELTKYIARHRPALVVIERPSRVYYFGKGNSAPIQARSSIAAGLIATAEVAGELRHACRIAGVKTKMVDADEVRKAWSLNNGTEAQRNDSVARVVGMLIAGWPKRTNTHERDAALAALWGSQ